MEATVSEWLAFRGGISSGGVQSRGRAVLRFTTGAVVFSSSRRSTDLHRSSRTMKKIVHIVGTGTIGEPLIGLFTDFRRQDGHRRGDIPQAHPAGVDRAKLNHLMARGAELAVDTGQRTTFEALGHTVSYEAKRRSSAPPWSSTARRRATRTRSSLLAPHGPTGFHRPGQRVRLRQALRPRRQRRSAGGRTRTGSSRSCPATPTTSRPC